MGDDIYQKLIKGYTEKQWGRDCKELPPFILKRVPCALPLTTTTSPTPIRHPPGGVRRLGGAAAYGQRCAPLHPL